MKKRKKLRGLTGGKALFLKFRSTIEEICFFQE